MKQIRDKLIDENTVVIEPSTWRLCHDPLEGKALYPWQIELNEKLSKDADNTLWVWSERGCDGKSMYAISLLFRDMQQNKGYNKGVMWTHANSDDDEELEFINAM